MAINDFKDKVLSTLGKATDGAKDLAGIAVDKAKSGGRIAKLSMEAASAREEVKKTYLEIGKLYYDTHKDDPEGFFIQLFEEVRVAEENIAAKEEELASLREALKEGALEVRVEIERVVDQAGDTAGSVKDTVADKFGTVKDAAAEKFDSVKKAVGERFGAAKDDAAEAMEDLDQQLEQAEQAAEEAVEKVVEAAEDAVEDAAQEDQTN